MGISIVTMVGINRAYHNIYNADIFDDISLPDGIDRDILTERIFIRCGEFSVMHTDIDFLRFQILNFFKVHYRTFDKWVKALNIEYNPLENYDRHEDYSGSGSNDGNNTARGSSSNSSSNSNTQTGTRAAFNSGSYEPFERVTTSGSENNNSSSDTSGSEHGSYDDEHTSHIHGNIGVTTSQQMLQSEWEIDKLNIYTAIADMFADEFVIMVY